MYFAFFAFVLPAHAVVSCFHNDLRDYGNLTEKVVEFIGSKTHRETVEEYASSHNVQPNIVQADVAATGRLVCGKETLTANVVVKGDVLLTAGHALVDPDTCKINSEPQGCVFSVEGKPPVRIKERIASGDKCPVLKAHDSDWAILRLEHVIDGVEPYKLEQRDSRDGVVTRPVIAVGNQSADFRRKQAGKTVMPKHLQDCSVRRVFYKYDPAVLSSDCDGSFGKSGGALLSSNLNDHVIIGMSIGSPPQTKAEAQREIKDGTPTKKKFDDLNQHDTGYAIDGQLRDALIKATQ